jgi:hypothetical protein
MQPDRPPVLLWHLRLGLGCGVAGACWHLWRAAHRLLAVAADFSQVDAAALGGTVIRGEAALVLACLAVGVLLGGFGAAVVIGLHRLVPPLHGRFPRLLGLAATGTAAALMVAREMALHPALFEVGYLRSDGKAGLLGFVADRCGPQLFAGGLLLLLAVAAVAPVVKLVTLVRRWSLWTLLGAAALLTLVPLAGLVLGGGGANNGPNVLVLAADSLRADHFSANGYQRDTTPNIDGLVKTGVSFSEIHTPQARTIPSWTSVLTGLPPPEHGIDTMFPSADARHLAAPTVPALLAATGVHTAVVSDYAGDFFSLVDYGFAERHTPPAMSAAVVAQRELVLAAPSLLAFLNNAAGRALFPVLSFLPNNADPRWVTDDLIDTLRRASRRHDRFFVVAFYSVSHIPYAAPTPDHRRYRRPGYAGENRYSFALRELADLQRADQPLPPGEVEQAVALYDGAVHAFDREVGRVLAELERSGLVRNTTVVVMGDHGEVLRGGPRGMQHGNALSDEDDLRLPLVVRRPGALQPHLRVAALRSGVDLAPTFLRFFDVAPPPEMRGASLFDGLRASERAAAAVYVETGEWLLARPRPDPDAPAYPLLGDLIASDQEGALSVRPRYRALVQRVRERGVLDSGWRLVLEPGRQGGHFRLERRGPSLDAGEAERRASAHRLSELLERELEAIPGGRLDRAGRQFDQQFFGD